MDPQPQVRNLWVLVCPLLPPSRQRGRAIPVRTAPVCHPAPDVLTTWPWGHGSARETPVPFLLTGTPTIPVQNNPQHASGGRTGHLRLQPGALPCLLTERSQNEAKPSAWPRPSPEPALLTATALATCSRTGCRSGLPAPKPLHRQVPLPGTLFPDPVTHPPTPSCRAALCRSASLPSAPMAHRLRSYSPLIMSVCLSVHSPLPC